MRNKILLPLLTSFSLLFGCAVSTAAQYNEDECLDLSRYFFSQEDVDNLFGDLPQFLDLGSTTLNRLNHIPCPHYEDSCLVVPDRYGRLHKTRSSFSDLETRIEDIFAKCQGDWSIYIKDLSNDEVISINEHSMQSASEIKLYIAGAALERIESGELEETDTIKNALYQMITVSDNESANILVRSFYNSSKGESFQDGLDVVNDFAKRHGFVNTKQVNGIADSSLWINSGYNITSTADCGKILELIYDRELVSHYASYRFESLLNQQQVNYKIPQGLPSGTHLAHKTGEISDTENDVAIIYTPYGDYIFCIMSTEQSDTGSAVSTIQKITSFVYDWFTHPYEIIDPADEEQTEAEQ